MSKRAATHAGRTRPRVGGLVVVTRALRSLLFGVGTAEPATMVSVSAILVAVATFAPYVPAARATRVDPATVLREE